MRKYPKRCKRGEDEKDSIYRGIDVVANMV